MENHHFSWVNPLFLWSFSIANEALPCLKEEHVQLLGHCSSLGVLHASVSLRQCCANAKRIHQ
jgi:hypothetical protein